MYVRTVQVSLKSGAITEAINYFRDTVGPALKDHAGFVYSRFLVDSTNNRCMMVTAWESAAARTEAETNGFLQDVMTNMKPHFAGPPVVDYYEVAVKVD